MKIYREADADISFLSGKLVAVIGYGNQGSAQAKCLRESGVNLVVGLRKGSKSWAVAEEDRMRVLEIGEAVRKSDVILLLIPDIAQADAYSKFIGPNLSSGKVLCFAHGFSIAYGLVKPLKKIDVVMVVPKATGSRMREAFLNGEGVPGLISVHQDHSGKAKAVALALAKAIGLTRKGVFECAFAQEAFANLFAEQCVTVGGQVSLLKAGFDTMVKNGIPPEVAYIECVEVSRLMLEMIGKEGLRQAVCGISETAAYGALTRGRKVIGAESKKEMQKAFDGIRNGSFAKEWVAEHASGKRAFNEMKKQESVHPLEPVGKKMRKALG